MKSKYDLSKDNIRLLVIPKDIYAIFEEVYDKNAPEKMRDALKWEAGNLKKMSDTEEHIL